MIPGEPILQARSDANRWSPVLQRIDIERAVWATTVRFVAYLALVAVTWWSITWWTENPTIDDTCVTPPVGPGVDYRGFDGAWLYNGHIIGYTRTEDGGCLSSVPL